MITDELTFDLNVRNVQTTILGGFLGACLPDCIQVRLSSYDSTVSVFAPVFNPVQTFNIDTRCAGNSLVSRTNYGAFNYREDFNVQCPASEAKTIKIPDWVNPYTGARTIDAVVGDTIEFGWPIDEIQNVFIHPSNSCDTAGAILVGSP